LPRVFEPFVQERSAADGGLGIGLNVVKRLVEMHGGTVAAHSEGLGRGTELVIRLPRAYPKPRATTRGERLPAACPRGLSVVLVEDDPDVREMTAELLRALGHRVSVANDAESGVEAICTLVPDLALVDIGLPGVSGFGVPERVQQRLGAHGVRIVALTGYGDEAARQRATESGFVAYLVKPIDVSALEAVLREVPPKQQV
jgi:CheY-like chemotaxis protein